MAAEWEYLSMFSTMTAPALALVGWTFVMWGWLYLARLPAMRRVGIDARKITSKDDLGSLPQSVKNVADNYNHLHEQPVLFYFITLYSQQFGVSDALNIALAWGYVFARVTHSLVQGSWNYVPARFVVFAFGTILLFFIFLRNVLPLFLGLT